MHNSGKRLFIIDVWIIIALFFVIVGHCSSSFAPPWHDKLKQWIYSFHMGVFFFIASFLMHYRKKTIKNFSNYVSLIRDKFLKFAPPFVILGILLSLIPLAQHHFSAKAIHTALNLFYRPTASYVIFLWFIYVLFEFYLIAPFISRFYNPAIIIFLLIAIELSLIRVNSNLFAIHLFARHFIFLLLGIIAAENINILRNIPHLPVYLLACFFLYLSIFHPGLFYPSSGVLALPFMLALSWICAPLVRPFAEVLGLDKDNSERIEFHEITKSAVLTAFEHGREINMDLVRSQESRRILDRIIGFSLSKLLQNKIGSKSAGRVQSVALKLICEREKEVLAFIPEEYWDIYLDFKEKDTKVRAKLTLDGEEKIQLIA